jgi:glycosyltransferase involved in cell wall biosynthesis
MRIIIFPQSCLPIHACSLDERPLGGVETGIIRIAEELHKRGHEVEVYTSHKNPPPSEPKYLPISQARSMKAADVFICIREWFPLMSQLPVKAKVFWSGDNADQIQTMGLGDKRVARLIDSFITVSNWQAEDLCQKSGFPIDKCCPISNGYHAPYFEGTEERNRFRLIYSSTPFRGLYLLPGIFLALKKKYPQLEFHAFSGYQVYHSPGRIYQEAAEKEFALFVEKTKEIPDFHIHGNVTQAELAREYMKSGILAYPNTFVETNCITALEAQAAGVPAVTTRLGALTETVADCGILLDPPANTIEYRQQFIAAIDHLLSDETHWEKLSAKGKERARNYSWEKIALQFEACFERLLERA